MTSYYDNLGLSPAASKDEIQQAIEAQYNQVRRLVNHHDPNMVNKANQALLVLEQARNTLLDENKRQAYDASLGIMGSTVAGVADPNLVNQMPAPVSSPVTASFLQPAVPSPQALASGWVCQYCGVTSHKGTMFCANCGKEVGRICPSCQAAYEARARFCPTCGIPYETATRRAEITTRLSQMRNQKYSLESQASAVSSMDMRSIEYFWTIAGGWGFFLAGTSVLVILISLFRLIFGFLPWDVINNQVTRVIMDILNVIFSIARWVVLGFSVAFLAFYLEKRKGIRPDRVALAGFAGLVLLAMLFGGPNVRQQLGNRTGNAWLIFPALVSGGLFLWSGWILRQHKAPSQSLTIPMNSLILIPLQNYWDKVFVYSQNQPWLLAGVGGGMSLAVLIFSAMAPLVSFFAGIVSVGIALLHSVTAYRAWTLRDIQWELFERSRNVAQTNLAQLSAEINQLEMELNSLSSSNIRS